MKETHYNIQQKRRRGCGRGGYSWSTVTKLHVHDLLGLGKNSDWLKIERTNQRA